MVRKVRPMSSTSESDPKRLETAQIYCQKGNDAALKSNFDYAIDMYKSALKIDPKNILYRQCLRGVERRKFGNDPGRVGRLVGARVQPIRLHARAAKSRQHWDRVLELCEEAFEHNPWDVSVAEDAAHAAEQLGQPELAKWLLESVHAEGANNPGFLRHQARVYALNEDWDRAVQ